MIAYKDLKPEQIAGLREYVETFMYGELLALHVVSYPDCDGSCEMFQRFLEKRGYHYRG